MVRRSMPTTAKALLGVLLSCGFLAATAYAQSSKDIQNVAKKLTKSKKPEERADAAEQLGRWAVPEVLPPLIAALGDPASDVREAAARSLWNVSKVAEPARGALQKALGDPEPAVAIAAAGALEAMGVPEVELKPTFERVFETGRELSDRFLAARGLIGLVPGPRVLPVILEYLLQQEKSTERSYHNRDLAKEALAQLVETKDPALDAALVSTLSSADVIVRKAILAAQSDEDYAKRLLPALVRLIRDDPDKDVRQAALRLAQQLSAPPKDLLAVVQKAMTDPDEGVRSAAADVVNMAQHRDLERKLRQAKGVEGVNAALAQAGGGPVAALITTLRTGATEQERTQAAQALSKMTVAADNAAPALAEAVLKDPSPKVRLGAASALADLAGIRDSQMAVVKTLLQGLKREQTPSARVEIHRALWKQARHNAEAAALVVPVLEAALQDPEEGVRAEAKEGLTWLKR